MCSYGRSHICTILWLWILISRASKLKDIKKHWRLIHISTRWRYDPSMTFRRAGPLRCEGRHTRLWPQDFVYSKLGKEVIKRDLPTTIALFSRWEERRVNLADILSWLLLMPRLDKLGGHKKSRIRIICRRRGCSSGWAIAWHAAWRRWIENLPEDGSVQYNCRATCSFFGRWMEFAENLQLPLC